MLNLFLLTAGTWTAISFLFVWRLASAIPLGSDHAADTLPVDREARVSPWATSPLKIGCERERARHPGRQRLYVLHGSTASGVRTIRACGCSLTSRSSTTASGSSSCA
jgi:hypothetical protein